jgi:hypothetical protein
MRSGDPVMFDVALLDTAGAGLSYANKTAFEAAGWSLSFRDPATGSALGVQPSYTITAASGVTGRHTVLVTLSTTAWYIRITPPSTAYDFAVLPGAMWDGSTYDADDVYSRLSTVFGVSNGSTVNTVTLPNLVEGDSYLATVTVPQAYLTRMGWTDLTGATLTGTIRRPEDTTTGTPACTLDATGTPPNGLLAVNGTDPRAVDISWTTYPTGMVLTSPERTAGTVNFRVEVQAVKTGKKLTVLYNATLATFRQDNTA